MADLKSLYESLDFKNIETYIQSGNVIFESDVKDISNLKEIIEAAIQKKYKFHVPVELRTKLEFKNIIKNSPFGAIDLEADGTKVLVTFLSAKPTKTKIADVSEYVILPEITTLSWTPKASKKTPTLI